MSELRPRGGRRAPEPTIARHGRLRPPGPVATILKFLAAGLAVVLVSGAAVVGYAVWDIASSVKPGVALIGETEGPAPDIGAIEGGVNMLLVGSDSGEGDPAYGRRGEHLNDVTILLHISADHTNATVVSFPRDLFVRIPSCPKVDGSGNWGSQSSAKINVALSYGGLACVVETVKEVTGLDIPFAAKIEFNGVIEMSNAIGGVTVCVASAIHDGQIGLDLAAGPQTLKGWNALMFLRSRYGVNGGTDLARISNQQVFMSALVRQVKARETLTDPIKVYGLAKAAVDNMEVSNSLRNPLTLASIALALKDIPAENIQLIQYPSRFGNSNGQGGVLPIQDAADKLFAAIAADLPVQITGSTGPGASLDPNATTPPADPSATGAPSDPATPPLANVVPLPSTITGQSSAQQTCSEGQTYRP
ncbi:LCP family protein [Leifsonia bigeumensis]|uniref:LCP family protein n=1 Tax=Leifsonella bigeumensis TaxID=433643 RepID=A0ABP7FJW7_9MICO